MNQTFTRRNFAAHFASLLSALGIASVLSKQAAAENSSGQDMAQSAS